MKFQQAIGCICLLVGCASTTLGDLITFKIIGKVTASNVPDYAVGKSYDLTFTVDTLAAGQPGRTSAETIYTMGARDVIFNYEGTSRSRLTAQINVGNNSEMEPFGDAFLMSYMGFADFDSFGVEDDSGQVFTSESMPDDLSLTQFSKRYFHLMWGITGKQFASFSIDKIIKQARFPSITSVVEGNGMLTLNILLRPVNGSHQQRTVLQKITALRDDGEWTPVTTFDLSESSVEYQVPVAPDASSTFYRVLMVTE